MIIAVVLAIASTYLYGIYCIHYYYKIYKGTWRDFLMEEDERQDLELRVMVFLKASEQEHPEVFNTLSVQPLIECLGGEEAWKRLRRSPLMLALEHCSLWPLTKDVNANTSAELVCINCYKVYTQPDGEAITLTCSSICQMHRDTRIRRMTGYDPLPLPPLPKRNAWPSE